MEVHVYLLIFSHWTHHFVCRYYYRRVFMNLYWQYSVFIYLFLVFARCNEFTVFVFWSDIVLNFHILMRFFFRIGYLSRRFLFPLYQILHFRASLDFWKTIRVLLCLQAFLIHYRNIKNRRDHWYSEIKLCLLWRRQECAWMSSSRIKK